MDKMLGKHVFVVNPQDNGGESFMLTTEIYSNGDPGCIYLNQELTLQSYGNSASFNLADAVLTPEILRRLADELEARINGVKV